METKSGPGFTLAQTETIRREIPKLIEKYAIKTLVDYPCGDFNWMKEMLKNVEVLYLGFDGDSGLVKENVEKYCSKSINFDSIDAIKDTLPKADLILCRDCFVHLPYNTAKQIIRNMKKSGSKYLLTTTFVRRMVNEDYSGWRPINLQMGPFLFPPALEIINENCTEVDGCYSDKCLALWKLDDIVILYD